MALTDENGNTGMVMPVAPMYGSGGNGGNDMFGGNSGWWIILLFILLGGWGNNGYGGGFGGGGINELYPWMNNSQNINNGFRDQMLNDNITSIRDGVFGLSNQLCNGFAGTTAAITGAQNALTQQMYTNQIADMERSFAAQTANTAGMTALQAQLASCCCDNRAGLADLRYTVATEACADRSAISDALQSVIAANTASTQRILDQLCADKIDQKNDTIAQLRSELLYARGQASQDVQTAQILAGQASEVDGVYNRLMNCPIPTVPVYGRQNIFTCQNNGCGCGA